MTTTQRTYPESTGSVVDGWTSSWTEVWMMDSSTEDTPPAADKYEGTETIAIFITLGFIGVIGNTFVIVVLMSSKTLRNSLVNIFLINQSFMDLGASLMAIITSPNKANAAGIPNNFGGELYCRFWGTKVPLWGLIFSSTWNLVALNLERYLSIVFPIFHKTSLKQKHIFCLLPFIWLFGPIEKTCFLAASSNVIDGKCVAVSLWPSKDFGLFMGLLNCILQFIVPLLFMLYVYVHMTCVLKRKDNTVAPTTPNTQGQNPLQAGEGNAGTASHLQVPSGNTKAVKGPTDRMAAARKNVFKTLLTVTVCFIACWIWNSVYVLVYLSGANIKMAGPFYVLTVYAAFCNCIINPFIYCIQYKPFQKQALKLIGGKCNRNYEESNTTNTVGSTANTVQSVNSS